jgi:hypothetical protein
MRGNLPGPGLEGGAVAFFTLNGPLHHSRLVFDKKNSGNILSLCQGIEYHPTVDPFHSEIRGDNDPVSSGSYAYGTISVHTGFIGSR